MQTSALYCFVTFLTLTLFVGGAEPSPTGAGHWEGGISLPTTKLAIRVDLEQTGGTWTGTIDIPAQGLRGFKLGSIHVDGSDVRFAMPDIPGDPTFAGKLESDGRKISGLFAQAGQFLPFAMERKAAGGRAGPKESEKGIPGRGFAGFWRGVLKVAPAVELRIALEITAGKDGQLKGTMISLDQGSSRSAFTSVTEEESGVRFETKGNGGSFDGKFSADGAELSGEWLQNGQKLPLLFKRQAKAAKLKRPQEPRRPYPYTEQQVVVDTHAAGMTLAGTLTLPEGAGPHPAVVLISGSGPQDRDEAIMGHRPFLVLADHLTRAGIAVLRYDDRGVGRSSGNFALATHTDFVEDALAVVAWLKQRKDIDPTRIGLLGHSEGGIVAPLAAVKRPGDIAFVVLAAGVGVPMQEVLIRQGADIARAAGVPEESITRMATSQRKWYANLQSATDNTGAEKLMRAMIDQDLAQYSPAQRTAMGLTESKLAAQAKMAATPWFRQMIAYDPRPTLREVKCPVLAINGEKDIQVAAKDNLQAIRESLAAAGNSRVKVIELPGLNHLFQTCTTGAVAEYGEIEETFAPIALKTISEWLRSQTGLVK